MIDTALFSGIDFSLIVKIILLILIGMYAIFTVVTFINIRSLHRVVLIEKSLGSPLIQLFALLYLLATFCLFIAALVIL